MAHAAANSKTTASGVNLPEATTLPAPRRALRRHQCRLRRPAALAGAYHAPERTLAVPVCRTLTADILCLADRGFLSFDLWQLATARGAALLWRASAVVTLPILERYADGSYRSALRWNAACTSADRTAQPVRVIEYTVPGAAGPATRYRLVTTLLEPARALAASWRSSITNAGKSRPRSMN